MKELMQTIVLGLALFSMFFGGGNLTFPLWIGSETSSAASSFFGFFLTGVLLPFYGLGIALYFGGDYRSYLYSCGKRFGSLLVFALLLFWIPLGSAPRCNLLAWGAIETAGLSMPLTIFSALYSLMVFGFCYSESKVLEILGKFITPILLISLTWMIGALFMGHNPLSGTAGLNLNDFSKAFFTGYHTQDFIAAIFFAATVIAILKDRDGKNFKIRYVRNAGIIAMTLLSMVYIGLIFVGYAHADVLSAMPKERLLAAIGQISLSEEFQIILFLAIFMSVLSTSIAITLVFSDYIRKDLFDDKISHPVALLITSVMGYILSIMGFERLATVIGHAMNFVYPALLFVTTYALLKSLWSSKKKLCWN